jgi:hypothetical protein
MKSTISRILSTFCQCCLFGVAGIVSHSRSPHPSCSVVQLNCILARAAFPAACHHLVRSAGVFHAGVTINMRHLDRAAHLLQTKRTEYESVLSAIPRRTLTSRSPSCPSSNPRSFLNSSKFRPTSSFSMIRCFEADTMQTVYCSLTSVTTEFCRLLADRNLFARCNVDMGRNDILIG